LISDFDPGQSIISSKKAFTFGASREAYEKVYIPSQKISIEKNLPGPGQYTLLSSIGNEGRKYSL
jgi:propanediol utilization protein